jgi:AraC family transcriptional regulator
MELEKPKIISDKIFRIMGCVYYGNPFHTYKGWDTKNEIGNTWRRFEKISKKYWSFLEKIKTGEDYGFEVHIEPKNYADVKKFHILVGIEVKNLEFFPLEMFYKEFPKTNYLFLTSRYKGNGIDYYFTEWLPESDYEQSYPYIMQAYSPKRWNNNDLDNSLMDWYIPIKEKED